MWSGNRRKGKFEWQERGAENREGTLGSLGSRSPCFTKDSKTPREKENITRVPWERETRTHLKKVSPEGHGWPDVVQSDVQISDDFFQHLWPYIGNNTSNVVLQMVKRLWLIRIDQ
ncbi:hypothetical protein TNCV_1796951 [Trichonephila clavipes]|nr:hypothetical protein TNCV_1796951 [Trichonephila clavipes]